MLNGLALTPFFMMGLALTPCLYVAVDDDWACTYPLLHDGASTYPWLVSWGSHFTPFSESGYKYFNQKIEKYHNHGWDSFAHLM
jgi:hypothetical protein